MLAESDDEESDDEDEGDKGEAVFNSFWTQQKETRCDIVEFSITEYMPRFTGIYSFLGWI